VLAAVHPGVRGGGLGEREDRIDDGLQAAGLEDHVEDDVRAAPSGRLERAGDEILGAVIDPDVGPELRAAGAERLAYRVTRQKARQAICSPNDLGTARRRRIRARATPTIPKPKSAHVPGSGMAAKPYVASSAV